MKGIEAGFKSQPPRVYLIYECSPLGVGLRPRRDMTAGLTHYEVWV